MKKTLATIFFALITVVTTQSVEAARPVKQSSAKHSVKHSTAKHPAAKHPVAKRSASNQTTTPRLASRHVMVVDTTNGKELLAKNESATVPIASITKLMTAMVVLDAKLPMDQTLTINNEDVDNLKHSCSRLRIGTQHTRYEMLRLALMSSENRAASALGRHYPGGKRAFVAAMQAKARQLGMTNSRFVDTTGLSPQNQSSAEDLVKMVQAASRYDTIHQFTTTDKREVSFNSPHRYSLGFMNTNALVRGKKWDIDVSKTGYTNEAGRCLVMMVNVAHRPVVMVLLDSDGKYSPVGDANRIKTWLEKTGGAPSVIAQRAPQPRTAPREKT